jgi:hypothetical protein
MNNRKGVYFARTKAASESGSGFAEYQIYHHGELVGSLINSGRWTARIKGTIIARADNRKAARESVVEYLQRGPEFRETTDAIVVDLKTRPAVILKSRRIYPPDIARQIDALDTQELGRDFARLNYRDLPRPLDVLFTAADNVHLLGEDPCPLDFEALAAAIADTVAGATFPSGLGEGAGEQIKHAIRTLTREALAAVETLTQRVCTP